MQGLVRKPLITKTAERAGWLVYFLPHCLTPEKRNIMTLNNFSDVFTAENLRNIFPEERADAFFEALYGDAEDGAYDISLAFNKAEGNTLYFDFLLMQRPGKCLACNLTHGLPTVFERHPIINLNGIAKEIEDLLDHRVICTGWKVGTTKEKNRQLHKLPVQFTLSPRT